MTYWAVHRYPDGTRSSSPHATFAAAKAKILRRLAFLQTDRFSLTEDQRTELCHLAADINLCSSPFHESAAGLDFYIYEKE